MPGSPSLQPPSLPPFEAKIAQELSSLPYVASLEHLDEATVGTLFETLTGLQRDLETHGSNYRLFWCFAPQLAMWFGPCETFQPRSRFLTERLHDTPIWSLSYEYVWLGDLGTDTMVLDGPYQQEIMLRPSRYKDVLASELLHEPLKYKPIVEALGGGEETLRWRQEVNLAHEWGHLHADQNIPYKQNLLDKLESYAPEDAYPVVAKAKEYLEGLAELAEGQGAVSFVLAVAKEQPNVAQALLQDRLYEYPISGMEALLPGLVATVQGLLETASKTKDWQGLEAIVTQLSELLRASLLKLVERLPTNPSEAKHFLEGWALDWRLEVKNHWDRVRSL
ncbi:MAG: hypothetical protein EP343_16855 [Deltaproteobacteria bacterium]|nr:MAG: hypothetical protein EP343_16855 [Deltaproteobacteria bacterium]